MSVSGLVKKTFDNPAGRILGVLVVLAAAFTVYELISRPLIRQWGTQEDETTRALPGDDIISPASHQETRGITVDAPASIVWNWVAQLGQDRGGFYSFRGLENFLGSEMPDVRNLNPGLQHWSVGDRLWMLPESKGDGKGFMTLREIDPGRALAFEGQSPFGPLRGTFTLIVAPDGPNRTRLLVRDRASTGGPAMAVLLSREIFEPMHFVMMRRMLLGIKALAEGRQIPTLGNHIQPVLWTLTGIIGIAAVVVSLRARRTGLGLMVLLASALLFQFLTFAQPSPVAGTILVIALALALVYGDSIRRLRFLPVGRGAGNYAHV